jgi:hypothetical protein
MMKKIKKNKKTYFIKVDTTIIGKIKNIFYKGIESYHHKREREIHFMREQVTTIISEREEIHYERVK